MYIFTRSVRLGNGHMRDSLAWALEITEKVNQISETPFSLWMPLFSPNAMRLTWGTLVEELEELEAVDAKLMADDTYVGLVDKGVTFGSGDPVDDTLVNYVHGDFATSAQVQCVSVVEAAVNPGHFGKGIEVGIEIAQAAERIGGAPTAFGIASTGRYGTVQWMTGFPSVAEMQRSEAAVNSDPSFLELLDTKAADLYVPGEQRIARKLA